MKVLTLNTHSWVEENPEEKLAQLAEKIIEENYDVIALQEVNQRRDSEAGIVGEWYCPVTDRVIHEDNFALRLTEALQVLGVDYYWTWGFSHIGYGIYDEGLAILSKQPILPNKYRVSQFTEEADYRRRILLTGLTEIDGQLVLVGSGHYSWWSQDGFAVEWATTEEILADSLYPLLLMGDFNNPEGNEGYQLITQGALQLTDIFQTAEQKIGSHTVAKAIDGWESNQEALRIDYIFISPELTAQTYQVMFDGKSGPVVSDHFGVAAVIHA